MADTLTISEARDQIEKLKGRMSGIRRGAEEKAERIQELAVVGGGAYLMGKYKGDVTSRGEEPFSIMGLSFEQSVAAVALVAGEVMDGTAGKVARNLGTACVAVAGYEMGRESASHTATTTTTTP